jgi:hypothetical protein
MHPHAVTLPARNLLEGVTKATPLLQSLVSLVMPGVS